MSYKPLGYSTVSPYLRVDGADAVIGFMKEVFGATELRRFADALGHLRHVEVRIDDTVLMIADCTDDCAALSSHVHVFVRDVSETYRLALDRGAVSVQEPHQEGDAGSFAGFRLPGGVTWWIATDTASSSAVASASA